MSEWIKRETSAPDPLAKFSKRPIISDAGGDLRYAGRVIVELWDRVDSTGISANEDAQSMAISTDATDGDDAGLTTRVAAALPKRIQGFSSDS